MEEKLINRYKKIVIVAGLIFLVTTSLMFYLDIISPEWKHYQGTYVDLASINDSLKSDTDLLTGLRQIEIEEFDHIDRCITCHLRIDKNVDAAEDLPFSGHPGQMLESHDLASFGCTLCHVGNGRSLVYDETCNPDFIIDWKPVKSNCSKCHLAFYNKSQKTKLPEETSHGLDIVYKSGCLGCHKFRQVGGRYGPDLTDLGDKIRQGYNFKNIRGKNSIYNWHREHFADPGIISPGTIMPDFQLDQGQIELLTTLVLGFSLPNLPFKYYDLSVLSEFKGERNQLNSDDTYALICSACHGQQGLGREYKNNIFGVPGLANPDFQAAASLDMISFIIQEGRTNRYMQSWKARHSGLNDNELLQVTRRIRDYRAIGPTLQEVKSVSYSTSIGYKIYMDHCSTCHQEDKSGGIGPSLNSQSFTSLASDNFLYATLTRGRPNTAMPSWTRLTASELHSLIRYLQPNEKTINESQTLEMNSSSVIKGQNIYHYRCSRCHGEEGNGGIGPGILKPGFLQAASDAFIIGTVRTGRSHTPMYGSKQNDDDLQELIRFMRHRQTVIKDFIHPGPILGNPDSGKKLFLKYCSDCHGLDGEGVKAPALNNQELLNAASNGYFLATITMGRENTPMPEWGKDTGQRRALNTKERHDLVAFIRHWQTLTIKREPSDPIYRLLSPEK